MFMKRKDLELGLLAISVASLLASGRLRKRARRRCGAGSAAAAADRSGRGRDTFRGGASGTVSASSRPRGTKLRRNWSQRAWCFRTSREACR